MKNIKLHVCVMLMIVIAELIGVKSFSVGPGKIVLLPMLYALIIGIFTTPRFLNIMKQKEMEDASSLIGLTLMLLMARYGTLVGPTLPKIISASPALILQELGHRPCRGTACRVLWTQAGNHRCGPFHSP